MTYAYSASNAVLHKVNHIPHLEQNSLELPLASQLETHSNGKTKKGMIEGKHIDVEVLLSWNNCMCWWSFSGLKTEKKKITGIQLVFL
jgi:predicted rRNA methylase YqxC with S4 and FtsJ domains